METITGTIEKIVYRNEALTLIDDWVDGGKEPKPVAKDGPTDGGLDGEVRLVLRIGVEVVAALLKGVGLVARVETA